MARKDVDRPSAAARLVALVALPLALYALYATGQKAMESYRLNQQAAEIRAEVDALKAENLQLQQQIEESRSDSTVEKMAREQLGLIKPGDQALVIVGPTSTPSAQPPPTPASSPPGDAASSQNWRQWWLYFFGSTED